MFCIKCGFKIEDDNAFCTHCGAKVPKMQPDVPVQKEIPSMEVPADDETVSITDFDEDPVSVSEDGDYQKTVLLDDELSNNDNISEYDHMGSSQTSESGSGETESFYNSAPVNLSKTENHVNSFGSSQLSDSENSGMQEPLQNRTVPSASSYLNQSSYDVSPAHTARINTKNNRKKPAVASQKKKGSAGLIIAIVFLIIAILAVLGVGGYFVYKTYFEESQYEVTSIKNRHADDADEDETTSSKKKKKKAGTDTTEAAGDVSEEQAENDAAAGAADETTLSAEATTEAPLVQPIYALNFRENFDLSRYMKIPVLNVNQSSYLVQKTTTIINYGSNAFDGDITTSWQDGTNGNGIGEWLFVSLDKKYNVSAITFDLGNHRSEEWYYKNNRPSHIGILIGGFYYSVVFPDQCKEFCVSFSQPISTDAIKFTVEGSYPGSEYNDMTISEIGVYGN